MTDTTISTISILGCGWLGLPLAKKLLEKGYLVKGSTTTTEKLGVLAESGIQPFLINLQPSVAEVHQSELYEFLQADILIIDIPPRTVIHGDEFHVQQIRSLAESISIPLPQIIYISSTSVYPDNNQVATEETEVIESNAMVQVEYLLRNISAATTILRCGGLMGYGRIPGKYVAGKTITTGNVPVNFIYRDDVVEVICEVIEQKKWGVTYNVVAPLHPVRRLVYDQNVKDLGFLPPVYDDSTLPAHKVISNDKLVQDLKYTFQFPDPVAFPYGS
ncbi:SDR family NAD(P)-dependent oxidoreductase [Xanthocytophaga agilis]|uniref:SDR family NAD(P)-dependent oxidoreductase n=1 Tax=Xanthocytophaga agilis TaxID=3048010 RepID=A0AAE3R3U6_9BACT|nr:SDR family NAD(P)-dependent oxidoreductase [Xanthocytophaga agilis]MDJ1502670.1 SDR family NAD(P)-dependent oxidoreductase [Xanthocytophaga agilis]